MKRNLRHIMAATIAIWASAACNKSSVDIQTPVFVDEASLTHGEIILGDQLENPYAVENVRSAFKSLYPTKAGTSITTTDYYVRFLPKDDGELSLLRSLDIEMLDHPVDYAIVKEGDYYHDPSIDEQSVTWQYAVVPLDFTFPDIEYEILEQCFLSEHAVKTKADGDVNWLDVEKEAYRITGNSGMIEAVTRGGESAQPSGRITFVDRDAAGGQPVGLSGVKVVCNVFVKFSSAYTDRDGYYKIPKTFTASPRYRLMFKNSIGFSIGFNAVLVPASVSTLGTNSPAGVDFTVNSDSDRRLFCRSAVNNAAYDFYTRCGSDDLGLATPPPSDLCFWLFDDMDSSSAVMLHHGSLMDKSSASEIFNAVGWIVEYFGPDITLGLSDVESAKDIYSLVAHEMSHACHFQQVGSAYWNKYILYVALCLVRRQGMYGNGTLQNAGYCCVGEMWAYYMESKLYKERYGGDNPLFGSSYWFHPQILTFLEDRGVGASGILAALVSDVTDKYSLKEKLIDLYPDMRTSINQVFNRYE